MAKDVKPTRKNLMAIEDRIDLSERGHDTLEQKRDGLIMEFMDILDQAQDVRSDVSENETAQRKIDMARAMEGDVAVRGAAAALKEHPEITTQSKNIMGVVVPQIESSKVKRVSMSVATGCSAPLRGSTRLRTPTRNCWRRSSSPPRSRQR